MRRSFRACGFKLPGGSCLIVVGTEGAALHAAVRTLRERDYIRGELDTFFSTLPTVAEGFQLKTWRGGPKVGKPRCRRSQVDWWRRSWPRSSEQFPANDKWVSAGFVTECRVCRGVERA